MDKNLPHVLVAALQVFVPVQAAAVPHLQVPDVVSQVFPFVQATVGHVVGAATIITYIISIN